MTPAEPSSVDPSDVDFHHQAFDESYPPCRTPNCAHAVRSHKDGYGACIVGTTEDPSREPGDQPCRCTGYDRIGPVPTPVDPIPEALTGVVFTDRDFADRAIRWLDGGVYRLVPGRDFPRTTNPRTATARLHDIAKGYGLRLRVKGLPDGSHAVQALLPSDHSGDVILPLRGVVVPNWEPEPYEQPVKWTRAQQ